MIVLAIDPGTTTGYCLVNIEEDKANIFNYGYIDVDVSSEYQGDHCIYLMKHIKKLIRKYNVDKICIEDYFFSKKFATGCMCNVAFRTAIHILARRKQIDYTIINVALWKKFVAGTSFPNKEQKKKWGKMAKKMYIKDALYRWYGFEFPEKIISKKSGKYIMFKHDIVDAIAQAVYYCSIICKIPYNNVSMTYL